MNRTHGLDGGAVIGAAVIGGLNATIDRGNPRVQFTTTEPRAGEGRTSTNEWRPVVRARRSTLLAARNFEAVM